MAIVLRYKCDIFMTENFANLDFFWGGVGFVRKFWILQRNLDQIPLQIWIYFTKNFCASSLSSLAMLNFSPST